MQKKYQISVTKGILREKEREFEVQDDHVGFETVYNLTKKAVKNLKKMENRVLVFKRNEESNEHHLEFIYDAELGELCSLFPVKVPKEIMWEVRQDVPGFEESKKEFYDFLFKEFMKNGSLTP